MNETEKQFKHIVEGLSIDDKADSRHKAALREQMLAAYTNSSASPNRIRIQPIWSKIMKSSITKSAAAAVILIGTFIFLTQGSSTTLAWAEVLEQIKEYRPYQCKLTVYYEGSEPKSRFTMHRSQSQRREERDDGSIYVFDMRQCPIRTLVMDEDKKFARLTINHEMGPAKDPDILRMLAEIQETDAEVIETVEINGSQTQGFRSVSEHNDITIWADEMTGLPVKVEIIHLNRGRKILLEDLQFDVLFDETLFSTEPPEDYTLEKIVRGKKAGTAESLPQNSVAEDELTVTGPEHFVPHSYTETVYINDKVLVERKVLHKTLSLRREVHFDDDSIHIVDLTEKPVRFIRIDPINKSAKLNIHYDMGPAKNPDMMAMLTGMRDGNAEKLGLENIDGFQAYGYRSLSAHNDITIWADAQTGYPVRIEIVRPGQKIIQQDFDFSTELDDSLFLVEAPEGYDLEKEIVGITLDPKTVTKEHVAQTATRSVYVIDTTLSWTKKPFIIESTDPSNPKEKLYLAIAVGNDGRHVVIGQSIAQQDLKERFRNQGNKCLEVDGFTVVNGGPEKWYSKTMLASAEGMIPPGISEDRTGYAIETPDGTILVIGINGPLTEDELLEFTLSLKSCQAD